MTKNQKSKLEEAIERLEKSYGKGTILTMDSKIKGNYDVISTGSIGFDWKVLGVGGFVKGRMYELMGWEASGKTTICGHAMAECQKKGYVGLYIDGEHCLDRIYFNALGVDTSKLMISQPSNGEEGFNIAMEAARSGEVDLIIIDSDSSFLPKAVIDGDVGESAIGKKARLNSDAYPKLKQAIVNNQVCMIVVSQYREKIGVMFGCLHGSTLINFTDGRSIPIKEVVKNKIKGKVYTINENNQISEREIINWHDNGLTDNFIHIETSGLDGQNTIGITVTPSHKILTNNGWKEARNITFSDCLTSRYTSKINGSFGDFIRGSMIGDCSILKRCKTTANIRFQDKANPEYLKWKIGKLSSCMNFTDRDNVYHSPYSSEFSIIQDNYPKRDPMLLFDNYSDLSLAVWFMDDGHFDSKDGHCRYIISLKRFKGEECKLQQVLDSFSSLGIKSDYRKDGSIVFDKENSIKIAERIYKYIPDCMQYKLPEQFKDGYKDFNLSCETFYKSHPVHIKSIRTASAKQMRYRRKYDISVEGDENYMAGGAKNGVIVHNSPTTTQGGHALKYYSDARVEIARTGFDKVDTDIHGNVTKVKSTKNKMYSPYRNTTFNIVYGKGIDVMAELAELGLEHGIIKKSGSWYSYDETTLGQGLGSVGVLLNDNPELFEEIRGKVMKAITT